MSNGHYYADYECTKDPKGCLNGQCTMCSFYKQKKSTKFLINLLLVVALMIVVPGFMILCWLYPLAVLTAVVILILATFLTVQPETKPCKCCGMYRLRVGDGDTCIDCRETIVNKRD